MAEVEEVEGEGEAVEAVEAVEVAAGDAEVEVADSAIGADVTGGHTLALAAIHTPIIP